MNLISTFLFKYKTLVLIVCTLCFFIITAVSAFAQTGATGSDLYNDPGVRAAVEGVTIAGGDEGPSESSIIGDALKELFFTIALAIGGIFTGFGGLLLDFSISHTVLGMGGWLRLGSGLGTGVHEIWAVIRDIVNILFIFGLIWIGIKTILNSEDSGARRTLGLLIIAALMINFSLYITQAIVDFTNIAAVQVHNQIVKGDISGDYSNNTTKLGAESIAGAFLNVAGVSSFFSEDSLGKKLSLGAVFAYSVFMMFFLIIAGIVFAMGAVLLVARFIALVLYMIFSPLMFLGFILPALASYQKQWWDGFLKQAFFAPAFLFMLYLSLMVLQRLKGSLIDSNSSYAMVIPLESGKAFTIILFFCLMIGFLYASIKVAQMMGGAGAATSLKVMGNMGKSIQGATQGYIGRNTIGRGSEKLLERYDKAVAEGRRKPNSFLRNRLETGTKAKFGSSNSWDSATSFDTETNKRSARINAKKKVSDSIAGAASALAVPYASRTPAQKLLITNMERSVKNASSAQLIEIAETNEGREMLEKAAGTLSASQIKALVDSDKLADDFKDKLGENRTKQVLDRVTDFGKANKADLTALGADNLVKEEVAVKLSEKQIDALDFVDADKDAIKGARKDALVKVITTGATVGGVTRTDWIQKKPDDIAELPKEVFADTTFVQGLSLAALEKIYHKHDKNTQAGIRLKLQMTASNRPGSSPQAQAMHDFLYNDRIGKNFGK